jgi:NAD(P)-dependent dehydrogenase (short-subunit alcohol dehydrogenase family)
MKKTRFFNLDGKVAIITGASTGLGAGIAIALAQHGAHVALSGKSKDRLQDTANKAKEFGNKVFTVEMDVRNVKQFDQAIQEVVNEFGRIDILVNNAGVNTPAPGLEVTEENWDEQYSINVKGGFFLAQKVAPTMIKQGFGRVIFIASQAGFIGIPNQSVYCSSKGAVIQVVRTLGVEWAKYGITVNAVAPTFVETNLTRERLKNPEFRKFVLGKIPSGKLAEIEHVAAATVFLASDEAAMVNCDHLRVDGGWTAW